MARSDFGRCDLTQADMNLVTDTRAFGLAPPVEAPGWVAELVFLILVFGVAICL